MAPEGRETHQDHLEQWRSCQGSAMAQAYETHQVLDWDGMGFVNDQHHLTPMFVLGEQGPLECRGQLCRVIRDRIEAQFPANQRWASAAWTRKVFPTPGSPRRSAKASPALRLSLSVCKAAV